MLFHRNSELVLNILILHLLTETLWPIKPNVTRTNGLSLTNITTNAKSDLGILNQSLAGVAPSDPGNVTRLQTTTPTNFTLEYSDTPPVLTDEQLKSFKEQENEADVGESVPLVNRNVSGPEPGTQTNTSNLSLKKFNISQYTVSPSISSVSLGTYKRVSDAHTYALNDVRGGSASVKLEPSIANKGNLIFYTANWFTARSIDRGRTWTFNTDPNLGMGVYFPLGQSRFCCDQDVVYDPQYKVFIWYTQASKDTDGRNYFRLAVSRDAQTWWSWNFEPTGVGLPISEDPNCQSARN